MNNSHQVFSRISPAEYAEVSVLARLIAENMLARMELVTLQPKVILDAGCGTGYGGDLLKQYYPEAMIVSLDLEETMVRYVKQVEVGNAVCADASRIPLRDHSVDMIFANLLLPWCDNWEALLLEWRRVLRPEGLLVFSCFGPDTLQTLPVHLPAIKDMHEIGDALVHAKFSDPVMDVEYVTLTYREKEKLFHELNVNGFEITEKSVQIEKNAAGVFETIYEIVYGHTWGPNEMVNHTADAEGVVKIPLSFLRNRRIMRNPPE